MAVERSELRLVWPPELFVREANTLLDAGADDDSLRLLLHEAFHGDRGVALLEELPGTVAPSGSGWGEPLPEEPRRSPRSDLLRQLVRDIDNIRPYEPPKYWSARQKEASEEAAKPPTFNEVKDEFAVRVANLDRNGYFEDAFGSRCSDQRDDPDAEGQRKLSRGLKTTKMVWPMEASEGVYTFHQRNWSMDEFLDVIEALHDHVARPRRRAWHSWADEWDYADFSRSSGQAVYRWQVNDLLARAKSPLRLADSGEDIGRLVQETGDDRERLVGQSLKTPDETDADAVAHAVALFRSRGAGRDTKRSAVQTLARVLEDRRSLLKQELLSKDEGALFQIANQFDIRHRRADQRTDYADAYLDWIFWWYLATVELTDRLIRQQQVGT